MRRLAAIVALVVALLTGCAGAPPAEPDPGALERKCAAALAVAATEEQRLAIAQLCAACAGQRAAPADALEIVRAIGAAGAELAEIALPILRGAGVLP